MASASVLSQTLQSITIIKIEELEKQRQIHNQRKTQILKSADEKSEDTRRRVSELLTGVRKLNLGSCTELNNIECWLRQSEYDPSVPEERLQQLEGKLRSTLDVESRKFDLADLYSRLLVEWIDSAKSSSTQETSMGYDGFRDGAHLEESYEVVEDIQKERLHQLREKFENVVFEPVETDEIEIEKYLYSLFVGDTNSKKGQKALDELRRSIKDQGIFLLSGVRLFNRQTLQWCIKSLLKSDLLTEEKRASLLDFLKDEAVLNEIEDVLNMRAAELRNWTWNLGDQGMPVAP